MMDRQPLWPIGGIGIFVRLVGNDHDLADALRRDLARHHVDGQRAIDRLTAGHRNGVIVKQLVGYARARCDRRADRKAARVEIGAVSQILEDVGNIGEAVKTDPKRSFRTHLCRPFGFPLRHEMRERVAADAGKIHRAVRMLG